MSEFNPQSFADWLNNAFRQSHYKSLSEVATLIGVSRTTMSMYAGAKPQTASNKPSRPKREICIRLAQVFNVDADYVLQLAGHAPQSDNLIISAFNDEFDESDIQKIREYIELLRLKKQSEKR